MQLLKKNPPLKMIAVMKKMAKIQLTHLQNQLLLSKLKKRSLVKKMIAVMRRRRRKLKKL